MHVSNDANQALSSSKHPKVDRLDSELAITSEDFSDAHTVAKVYVFPCSRMLSANYLCLQGERGYVL